MMAFIVIYSSNSKLNLLTSWQDMRKCSCIEENFKLLEDYGKWSCILENYLLPFCAIQSSILYVQEDSSTMELTV